MADTTLDILNTLVKSAMKNGADAADAVAVDARSKSISWREGKLEDVDASEGEDIGLRVLFGKKQAMVSTSNRSPDSLKTLVERAVAMARAVPDDEFCGLAPENRLAHAPYAELELFDATEVSADRLKETAAEAEDAARSVAGVTNTDGAGAGTSSWAISLITSHGFSGHYKGSSFSTSISAVAGEGTAMERDYDFSNKRFYADLDSAACVGHKAGELAVARLNPGRAPNKIMPLVFDPRVAKSMLGHFTGAITGPSVARGTSFLKDQMGQDVFAPGISIIDDPFIKRGLSSKLFDGEGVAMKKTALIEKGRLNSWLLNSASARQLGLEVTGHASRGTSGAPGVGCSNLYMEAGTLSPLELMADIKEGILITELIGMGVNAVTGDYSRGASGFMIRDGKRAEAVSEFTIAGNLKDMFRATVPASDLEMRYGVNTPTLRIDGMMVASG